MVRPDGTVRIPQILYSLSILNNLGAEQGLGITKLLKAQSNGIL